MKFIGGPQDGLEYKYPPKFRQTFWLSGVPGDKTLGLEQNRYGDLYRYEFIGDGIWKYSGR